MLAKVFPLFSTIKNKTIKKRLKKSKWFFLDKEAIHLSEHQINFRGKNGENYFHDLARKNPIMFVENLSSVNRISRLFNKSPRLASLLANSSIGTIINLMETPDNDGRYPLEYFLCFIDINNLILDQDGNDRKYKDSMITIRKKIEAIINSQWTRRPDWLEVKMLIVERSQTYSHLYSCIEFCVDPSVDSLFVIWKQKTQEDFRECLKTDRGKELIRMAANDFRYAFDYNYDSISIRSPFMDGLCGMEIHKYTHGTSYDCSFFDDIDIEDKNEVKLYLMQSWLLLFNNKIIATNEFVQKVEIFTHKAVELGIDVIELKEKVVSSFTMNKEWQTKLHKRMSKYNFWNSLEIINERGLLMQAVSLENRQDSAQTSSVAL